eukprot:493904-Rhodomonas_salina.1
MPMRQCPRPEPVLGVTGTEHAPDVLLRDLHCPFSLCVHCMLVACDRTESGVDRRGPSLEGGRAGEDGCFVVPDPQGLEASEVEKLLKMDFWPRLVSCRETPKKLDA